MSVKIHHGPPGSYKTSGAVMDDFVEAVFAGRVVITNVRGLNDEPRIREVLSKAFPKRRIPDSFELVWVDTETEEGIFDIQAFWIWADCGAFILIDEAQAFWPSEMRPGDWAPFALRGGVDAARIQGRPRDYPDAWTRHRHFNWDIVLTTPDIKLFHAKIRSVSEAAYIHKNQALIGIRGRYLEGMHLASNNGFSSDLFSVRHRKIPSWVFELYQSTSTGVVSDTKAGQPFWRDPKIMGLAIFLLVIVAFLVSRGNPLNIFRTKGTLADAPDSQNASVPMVPASSALSGRPVSDPFDDLRGKTIWLVGSQSFLSGKRILETLLFELQGPDEMMGVIITSDTLTRLGYSVTRINRNLVSVERDGQEYFIRSRGVQSEKKDIL
jgi:zona occludens toxin